MVKSVGRNKRVLWIWLCQYSVQVFPDSLSCRGLGMGRVVQIALYAWLKRPLAGSFASPEYVQTFPYLWGIDS